jgi:FMN reductase (NADPH)
MNMKPSPTIEQIYKHYSVRKYKPDPVSDDLVETVVAAGQRAATSSNLQTYSVVVVCDKQRRYKIAELCNNQDFIRQAPVFLAWCADQSRLKRVSQRRGYPNVSDTVESFLVAAVDVSLVMQTSALAAESLGLGICYVGAIRNHPLEVIEMLELPELVFPISGMALGWPAAEPFIRPRLPLRAILHWEKYETTDEGLALEEYDQAMIATGIYSGRQVPVPGADGEMENYGWQEHSARRVSSPIRQHLKKVLKDQGFDLK